MKTCDHCGKDVHEMRDIAFPMPYDIAALSEADRKKRAKISPDLGCLDGDRFFIRCVATVPIRDSDETLRWGVWAEISASLFRRYLEVYRDDATSEPAAPGTLANDARGYPPMRGHAITIRFGSAAERPQLVLDESDSLLSVEQHAGIDHARLHEILTLNGLDDDEDDAASAEPRLMKCPQPHPEEGWPFAEPPTIATFTTHEVMNGATILFARHEENGEWTILDREDVAMDDLVAVCLSHVVEREPKLTRLADLPCGWCAQRSGAKKKWDRWQESAE